MIDWVDCTTVMIGPPSPKTSPSILNNMCDLSACEPQGSAWLGDGQVRAIQRRSWSNVGSKFSLGRDKNRCNPSADDMSASHKTLVATCSSALDKRAGKFRNRKRPGTQ